jgi:hypothetical protein
MTTHNLPCDVEVLRIAKNGEVLFPSGPVKAVYYTQGQPLYRPVLRLAIKYMRLKKLRLDG